MADNPTDSALGGVSGKESVDAVWIILSTFIIFTMQSGFALLESGLFFSSSVPFFPKLWKNAEIMMSVINTSGTDRCM